MTVIGLVTIDLQIPASTSLKDKRRVLKSVIKRVGDTFNVSIAEVDHQDHWQLATLAVACVSTDAGHVHGLLEKVVRHIERMHLGLVLLDYETELL